MSLPENFIALLTDMAERGEITVKFDEPTAPLSGFKIGGNADAVICPTSIDALKKTIDTASRLGVRYGVFGNCSNVLFDDNGYRGALILTKGLSNIEVQENRITADCGASLMSLALAAERASLSGFEFAYGIPGSVGGAVYMNAGAYGGEIADVLCSSDCLFNDGSVKTLSKTDHNFAYRHSVYSECGGTVLSATFELEFAEKGEIRAKMDDLMSRRREKQPLEYPSAGSTFKRYPGYYTAKLIEEAGLKGYSIGGAQVSEKHAGFVINKGGATANDVCRLIDVIKEKIYQKEGIAIECEVVIVPEN